MTIPSRPAPPPPQSRQNSGGGQNASIKLSPPPTSTTVNTNVKERFSTASKSSSIARHFPTAHTRYAPITNWEDKPFPGGNSSIRNENKRIPPPRPPPPKIFVNNGSCLETTVLKKPGGPPQSVNVLSNLFGRKKTSNVKKPFLKIPPLPFSTISNNQNNQPLNLQQSQNNTDFQLISFDSPPSSPTLTQKSNSDCVSVDSFSSDSNFSSPHNGSISQTESGFEDDFISPIDPFESTTNENLNDNSQITFNDFKMTQPVRNINAINRTQNDNPLCNGKNILPPPPILAAPTIIRPKNLQNNNNTNSVHNTTQNKIKLPEIPSISKTDSQESDFCLDDLFPSLPMPNCPPPPPPPLEISDISLNNAELLETSDFGQPSYGIALYDFEGVEDGDLSLKANDKVYLLEQLNDEWYMGRNKRGCEGIFPRNYIDVKIPLGNETNSNIVKSTSQGFKNSTLVNTKAKVLYNFDAETSDDLSLKENEYVNILYKINDEWLFGEIDGKCGQFPANFVEHIPKNLPRTKTS